MALRPTTPEQVDGHAFLLQRARGAVVGQDITARGDRLRAGMRAAGAGVALGAVLVAGAAVLAFVRPAPDLGNETLVQVRESGALFVRVGQTWHPAPNLASARLVLGEPASPRAVPQEAMTEAAFGPQVGIPGAPALLPEDPGWEQVTWTVCDVPRRERDGREIVVAAAPADPGPGTWQSREAVLVERDGQGWLVGGGRRTRVDLADTALLEVFGLHTWPRQRMSDAALGLLPEGPPLERIDVPGAGDPAPHGPQGLRIGEVFAVSAAAERSWFVVLSGGVQEIPELVAEMLRVTGPSRDDATVRTLAPAQVTAPRVAELEFPGVPLVPPRQADLGQGPLCTYWSAATDGEEVAAAGVRTVPRLVAVAAGQPVRPAAADGPGPAVDGVVVPAAGLRVRPVASAHTGQVGFEQAVISPTGTRHGVAGAADADALGLVGPPIPVPTTVLRLLPLGPELSGTAARVVFDAPQAVPPDALLPSAAPDAPGRPG